MVYHGMYKTNEKAAWIVVPCRDARRCSGWSGARGPQAKFTRNRPTSVVTNTHWPCGGQRSQLRQLFWLLAAGDGIIRNRWEKTDLPHQHLSVHPGMQPGKAEASTAREWKRSLPFLGRVEVKDVRWSKIELPQVLSCGGKNDLINYVKQQLYRQNQLFQFTNKN